MADTEEDVELLIDDWAEQEKCIIDAFVKHAKQNRSSDSEFSLKRLARDWDDYFLAYHHGGDNDVP